MAADLSNFKNSIYVGTPYGQPIAIGVKPILPNQSPQTVRIDIPWYTYGASSANQQISVSGNLFAQQQQVSPLDFIRSVFIDNSYVDVPVYVQFPDTLHTIICPPNSQAMHPVLTYQQQFTVFGDGFKDGNTSTTSLFFSNIDRQGYYVPASIGGAANTIIVEKTDFKTGNLTTGTTIPVIIGDADTDRTIVVAVSSISRVNGLTGSNFITNINMGTGNKKEASAPSGFSYGSVGGFFSGETAIYSCPIPTGTTANLVIAVNNSLYTCTYALTVFSVRNISNPAAIAVANSTFGTGQGNGSMTQNIAAQNNGVVIVAASGAANANRAFVGVSQIDAQFLSNASGDGMYFNSAMGLIFNDGQYTVSSSGRSMVSASFA